MCQSDWQNAAAGTFQEGHAGAHYDSPLAERWGPDPEYHHLPPPHHKGDDLRRRPELCYPEDGGGENCYTRRNPQVSVN